MRTILSRHGAIPTIATIAAMLAGHLSLPRAAAADPGSGHAADTEVAPASVAAATAPEIEPGAPLAPGVQRPVAPTGLTASFTESRVNLSWDGAPVGSGVTQFTVYRTSFNACVGGPGVVCAAWFSATSVLGHLPATAGGQVFSDIVLQPQAPGRFEYSVSACNALGHCSPLSAPVQLITPLGKSPNTAVLVSATGSGYGEVVSVPAGISCYIPNPAAAYLVAPDCFESYEGSQEVTLTARPDAGSMFLGWGGACSGRASTCTVSVSHNLQTSVGARFMHLQNAAGCLFNWAELYFAEYVAPRGMHTHTASNIHFRFYPGTGSYLAVSEADQHVHFLGADKQLRDIGPLLDLGDAAGCQ